MSAPREVWVVYAGDVGVYSVLTDAGEAQQIALDANAQDDLYLSTSHRYVLPPDAETMAALQAVAEKFCHNLPPEQRALVRGYLGRVG